MVMRFTTMVLNSNVFSQAEPPIAPSPSPISLNSSSEGDWDSSTSIFIISAVIAFIVVEICIRAADICGFNCQPGRGATLPSLRRETTAPMHRGTRTGGARRTTLQAPPWLLSATSVKEILRTYQGGEQDEECAVCLNEFKVGEIYRVLPSCNHKFHRMCINGWLLRDRHCPLCRIFVQRIALPNTNT